MFTDKLRLMLLLLLIKTRIIEIFVRIKLLLVIVQKIRIYLFTLRKNIIPAAAISVYDKIVKPYGLVRSIRQTSNKTGI